VGFLHYTTNFLHYKNHPHVPLLKLPLIFLHYMSSGLFAHQKPGKPFWR